MIVGDVEGNTKGVVVTVFERVNPFYICRLVYRTVEASVIKGQRVFFLYKKQFCGDAVVVGLAEDVPVHIVVQPKISAVAEVQDDLKMLQKAVGGYIEAIYPEKGIIFVGNEEAKLEGLDGNRHYGDCILAGPFFVCGDAGENFRSLTDEEVTTYMARFAEPEEISQEEVKADMGFTIISF